jgi:DNA repair ATPase RecN
MSARDDYPKANANTSSIRGHLGETSRQTQDALDEIDRLRKLRKEMTRSHNEMVDARVAITVPAVDDQDRTIDAMQAEINRLDELTKEFKTVIGQVVDVWDGLEKRVAHIEVFGISTQIEGE